jgi:hypothetical protein|tara:strand:+ start:258 stop:686 length:429 start_codon:yes stop_codon:yes gene_type:complete
MVLYYSSSVRNVSNKNAYSPQKVINEQPVEGFSSVLSNASMRFSNYYSGPEKNEEDSQIEQEQLDELERMRNSRATAASKVASPAPMKPAGKKLKHQGDHHNDQHRVNTVRYNLIIERLEKIENYLLILLLIVAIIALKLFN